MHDQKNTLEKEVLGGPVVSDTDQAITHIFMNCFITTHMDQVFSNNIRDREENYWPNPKIYWI